MVCSSCATGITPHLLWVRNWLPPFHSLPRDFLTQTDLWQVRSRREGKWRLSWRTALTLPRTHSRGPDNSFLKYGEEMANSSSNREEEKGEIWNNWSLPQRKTIQKNFLSHTFKPTQGEQFRCQGFDQLLLTIMSMINISTVTPD